MLPPSQLTAILTGCLTSTSNKNRWQIEHLISVVGCIVPWLWHFSKCFFKDKEVITHCWSESILPSIDMEGIGMTGCLWVLTLPFSSDAGCGCLTRHLSIVQKGEKRGYDLRIKHYLILGPKHVCYMSRGQSQRETNWQAGPLRLNGLMSDWFACLSLQWLCNFLWS